MNLLLGIIIFSSVVAVVVFIVCFFIPKSHTRPIGNNEDWEVISDWSEQDYDNAALDLSKIDRGSYLGYDPQRAKVAHDLLDRYQLEIDAIDDLNWKKAHQGWLDWSRKRVRESEEEWNVRQRRLHLKTKDPLREPH